MSRKYIRVTVDVCYDEHDEDEVSEFVDQLSNYVDEIIDMDRIPLSILEFKWSHTKFVPTGIVYDVAGTKLLDPITTSYKPFVVPRVAVDETDDVVEDEEDAMLEAIDNGSLGFDNFGENN